MRRLLSLSLLALACALPALAQRTNNAVTFRESSSSVAIRDTIKLATADSVGVTYRSQAIQIDDANRGTAFVRMTTNDVAGTETITVALEVSNNLVTWDSLGTIATGIASTALTTDTLSTITNNSRVFQTARYFRIAIRGGAGNRRGVVFRYEAVLPKNNGAASGATSRAVSYSP